MGPHLGQREGEAARSPGFFLAIPDSTGEAKSPRKEKGLRKADKAGLAPEGRCTWGRKSPRENTEG